MNQPPIYQPLTFPFNFLQLVSVSAENKTISGKYINANFKQRTDISSLDGKDIGQKGFSATVISTHEFGIFAEIEEFGVEGLIPASKLRNVPGSFADVYP